MNRVMAVVVAAALLVSMAMPATGGWVHVVHTVGSGQSWEGIARRYGVSVRRLAGWQGYRCESSKTCPALVVGQSLEVWTWVTVAPATSARRWY